MSTKEIKALIEVGTSMGYSGEELKQFLTEERMRLDKEKEWQEKEKQIEQERLRTFELEKIHLENEAKAEATKAETEAAKETERMRLQTEATKAEAEAAKDTERMRIQAESETIKARMEHEYRIKEIEIRNRDLGAGSDAETNPNNNNNSNSSRSAGMKALKLPPFNEDKDDLDAYLIRFERACTAFEVRQEHRSTQLARLLQGKALDVYQRLADDEVDDYDVLKAQSLKRFRLTEGGYRKQFKTGKLEPGEMPAQFAERLKRYLEKWPVLSQHMKAYKK